MDAATSQPTEPSEFLAAMTLALALLKDARAAIESFLTALTPEQRESLTRAPLKLNEAARASMQAAESYPAIAAAARGYDGALIVRNLEIIEILAPLANQAEALARLADDTRLLRRSEAYQSILSLYRISREAAKDDPQLDVIIKPIREIYAAYKANTKGDK